VHVLCAGILSGGASGTLQIAGRPVKQLLLRCNVFTRLLDRACMRIENRQLNFAAVLAATLAGACLFISPSPAYAGWGKSFARTVLPSLVRRAAVSLIQQELYDLESDRSFSQSDAQDLDRYSGPAPAPNPDRYNALYPAPNPDRYNALYQAPNSHRYTAPIQATNPKRSMSGPQQVSGFQWTPRSALDYLQSDDHRMTDPSSLSASTRSSRNSMPSSAVARSFQRGLAGRHSYDQLVSANVFVSYPLHGSVFKRQGRVKYIILHSTETGSPADARRVIQSWNNRGLRHPGAQFVVDRDGTICSTVNPDQATVHIDTSKTLAGYSNDNSVGIEIVRSGKQQYTRSQLDSVTRLVAYLQSHYGVADSAVTTHHHVQPSDRSDPVNFDLVAFENDKSALQASALANANDQTSRSQIISANYANSKSQLADAKGVMQMMPKPAPDFRLRRN